MVVGAFPVAKLGSLLIRQISKPLAGYLKQGAKRSHVFRNWICLPTAQLYHRCETRYKLWILGLGKPTQITPLNEQMAVELGADILGEIIIFTIAGALLTAEYIRSSANAKAHEAEQERRLESLEHKLLDLDFLCEQQRTQLREMERRMHASPFRALKEKLVPSSGQSPASDQRTQASASISPPSGSTSTASASDKLNNSGDQSSNSKPDDATGMEINQSSSMTAIHSDPGAARNGELTEAPAYTSKVIRRAIKILLNTYEEVYDD